MFVCIAEREVVVVEVLVADKRHAKTVKPLLHATAELQASPPPPPPKTQPAHHKMVHTSMAAGGSDPTSITLTRLLARLHKTLIVPDEQTERKLHASSIEREKLETVRFSL